MSIELTATLAGLAFGSLGTFVTVRNHARQINKDWREKWDEEMVRKAKAEVKEYAAQRDFQHLQRNQEQMKKAIELLQEEQAEQGRAMVEVQTTMKGMFHQLSAIATKIDANTSGYGRSPSRD